jgi:hypothetical protein
MEQIQNFLECGEKILFGGTYNVNNVNQTGPTILNLQVMIEKNINGYNLLVDNFYNTKNNLLPPSNFLLETITISSYSNDMVIKNGQIQFTGFYKNNSSQDSATSENSFVIYSVNSTEGIYKGVTKVLLNAISDQRVLYFIGYN